MVGGRHALVDRLLQLRRPAGHLFGVSAAGERAAFEFGATRAAGVGLRVGVRAGGSGGGIHCGPGAAEVGHSGRAADLEPDLHGDGGSAQFPGAGAVPRGRRAGRDLLLSGIDVAGERLSRQRDAVAGAGHSSDQRVYRDDCGRILRGRDRAALRVEVVVHRVRRARRGAGAGIEPLPGGTRPAGRRPSKMPMGEFLRLLWNTPGGAATDGRVRVRRTLWQ